MSNTYISLATPCFWKFGKPCLASQGSQGFLPPPSHHMPKKRPCRTAKHINVTRKHPGKEGKKFSRYIC